MKIIEKLDIMAKKNEIVPQEEGEIVVYQPEDGNITLDVTIAEETVWLSQLQMASLFATTKQNISLHIGNIFREGELDKAKVVKDSFTPTRHGAIAGKVQNVKVTLYNLDVIISVGYRVKSPVGTRFRQWAMSVLKDYMLRGYAINQQMRWLEDKVDRRLAEHERILNKHQEQLDFFVRTNLPPVEQVFFEGDFFEARVLLERLIKSATKRVILVDGYVDAATFDILDVRADDVEATIYTHSVGEKIITLQAMHSEQQGAKAVEVRKWRIESHDRWLIIDERLYHCGHSIKDLGRKISAITLMGESPERIINELN